MKKRRTKVVVGDLAYPECPRWREGTLYFSDQHDGKVWRLDGQRLRVVLELASEPAGLGWDAQGELLVVSMQDRKLLRVRGGRTNKVADLRTLHPGLSNELLVDASGRSYVGNIGFDFYGGEEPRTTVLATVSRTGRIKVAADDLLVPNGMVFADEGRRLIVAESFRHQLTSFEVKANGVLTGRKVFADLGEQIPDGICLDAEGGIWFASIGAHEVVRVVEGGRVTDRVSTGDAEAIACTLGGPDLRTLFVCTAGTFDPTRTAVERGGAIESVRVDVPGAGSP
ncbi:SMP-30/gluconolactonase/LRE family protein [Dactylosporangium cerinum]|uniref:SMP-30/gluconolactonase/LRE family protein n=1 Tax=Dactylosporangium cerinum TaxID=1434730 RepID=A0ABV9VT82_9ACTN